jgi:ribosome biogenesis GTPase
LKEITGRIIKTYNGYYYVLDRDDTLYTCKVKGRMKQKHFVLATGDYVVAETEGNEGMIRTVLERKNLLQRPLIANLDCFFAVFACKDPDPSFLLIDKLLALSECAHIPTALVLNKIDLVTENFIECFRRVYEPLGIPVIAIEAKSGRNIESVRERIKGSTVAFGGPSGVGKSTLLNHLDPSFSLKTGAVSGKIGRGRHTTRFTQLLAYNGGFIADTPGFGNIDLAELELPSAEDGFREFRPYKGQCRFTGCTHTHEPDCAVKEALQKGRIAQSRYDSYVMIRQELASCRKRGRKV